MEVASQASDVLSDDRNDSDTSDTDEAVGSHSGYQEDDESADLPDTSDRWKTNCYKKESRSKTVKSQETH